MGKTDAVLEVLPFVFGAADDDTLLVQVVRALATPLELADAELFRIQRAHRLGLAPHPRDVVQLAGALDLGEFHFQDLLEAPLDHDRRLKMMRERVRSVARLHLEGLGTPWAVIASTAIFLGAHVVSDGEGSPLVRRLDEDSYSYRATVEFAHAQGGPRESIILHENPFRRLKVDPLARWPGDEWSVENSNVEVEPVRFAIRGVGDRTVGPTVFCPGLAGGIVFNGLVPDGETLLFDQRTGATIGDVDVTPWIVVYRGAMFDHAAMGSASLVVEEGGRGSPFWTLAGDLDEDAADPPRSLVLHAPLGRTTWCFTVHQGIYDGSLFDEAVFAAADAPVGRFEEDPPFDACVYDVPPSGVVGMAWDERVSCAIKLLLPAHVPALEGLDMGDSASADTAAAGMGASTATPAPDHVGRIAAILPRFRPAGITAFVERAPDGWELGRSVLRDAGAAAGEGIDFHSTRLASQLTENLVAFDPRV